VGEALAQGPGGKPSSEVVARALGMTVRTLRERLFCEGVTFAELLDTARKRHALLLVDARHLRVVDVASCVGYAHVQNFARAFRRWTGQSPRAYRRATQLAAPGQALPLLLDEDNR
jgi:AraC-like DNA-binding protein